MNSEYNAKNIRKSFAERGCFYTDSKLAELMRSELGDVEEVYDPTCGDGQLLSVFPDEVKKYGQEIDPAQLHHAEERLRNFIGYAGDTLKDPHFSDRRFKAISANYPFSIKWQPEAGDARFDVAPCLPPPSKADFAFLLHIIYMLADDGKAAVLNFPGILYRGNREGEIREWMVKKNYVEKVMNIEAGYFEDTKIATALMILRKNKASTDIEFVDHECGLSRIVPLEEVARNGYNLSVSTYVQPEEEKIDIDPIALEKAAEDDFIKKLRAELLMSLFACREEGMDIKPFIERIKHTIRDVEKMMSVQDLFYN